MGMEKQDQITVCVSDDQAGLRADKFLSLASGLSRSRIGQLLDQNQIDPMIDADAKVEIGQCFTITLPIPEEATPKPQNIALDILYEDTDLIVINKPAGMVVHPGAGNSDGTLVNALLAHCKDSLSGIGGVKRPGIVHRIDKDTSGVLVIAKNDKAHRILSEQFAKHDIHRVYNAVVYGLVPSSGTVTGNIGRSIANRQKMTLVKQSGKPAVTHYRLVKPLFNGKASLVDCQLETGRTHQIRVHMTSIKHPLVGDQTYGSAPKGTPDELRHFPRQALHAAELGFIHPTTKKEVLFTAPLPNDLLELINIDRHEPSPQDR